MGQEEIIALDVGGRRIGVARANSVARIPEPLATITVDGTELEQINDLAAELGARKLVIGLPRNQQGEETAQTQTVKDFAAKLDGYELIWQDESLTSVAAEDSLQKSGKAYAKADVDALAAAHILKDYLDSL